MPRGGLPLYKSWEKQTFKGIAPLVLNMTRKVTAGHMALRQSEHPPHNVEVPPWELAAFDAEGNELYRTEGFETREAALKSAGKANSSTGEYPLPDGVARFEPVKREE